MVKNLVNEPTESPTPPGLQESPPISPSEQPLPSPLPGPVIEWQETIVQERSTLKF